MKKTKTARFLTALLLTTAFFGMSSCEGYFIDPGKQEYAGKKGGPSTGGSGSGESNSGGGTLTITGLPSGGGYFVQVFAFGTDLSTYEARAQAITGTGTTYQAVSRDAPDNVFNLNILSWINPNETLSGLKEVLLTKPQGHSSGVLPDYRKATVNFSNGSATVPYSNFLQVDD